MMTTYYVVDVRTNSIVNTITTSDVPYLEGWEDAAYLRLETDPSLSMLRAYPYWCERP